MADRKTGIFYGYWVVAAAVCIMMITWGANRTFGVFLEPMLQEFGWTRAAISASFTLNMLVMGLLALAAGRLTDRFGARPVLFACGLFLGFSFLLSSRVASIWHFYLFYGLVGGVGMSGILTPLMSVVVRWFVRRRALMSGILVAGPALGIMILPLLFTYLISQVGWRLSYALLGVAVLAAILLPALFIRLDPAEMGLLPYGAAQGPRPSPGLPREGLDFGEAARTRQFWLINLLSFCDLYLINVVVVHIVVHALDMKIPPAKAAGVLSLAAGVSIPGRILMGALADRWGNRLILLICMALSVAAFVLLLWARTEGLLYLFSFLYGVSLWATGALISPLVAEYFGLRSHGTLFSWSVFAGALGSAAGPVITGVLFDATGSYRLAFVLCLLISLVALVSLLLLRPLRSG